MKARDAFEAIRGMLYIWELQGQAEYPAVKPTVEELTRDGIWTEQEAIDDLALWDQAEEDRAVLRKRQQAKAARFLRALLALDPRFEIPDAVLDAMNPIPVPPASAVDLPQDAVDRRFLRIVEEDES